MFRRIRQRRARRANEKLALRRLAALEAQLDLERHDRQARLPEPTHTLTHIEGAWQVPVARVDHPGSDDLYVTCAPADNLPAVQPGTLFSLTSSSFSDAKLSGLVRRGWALVQAWPLCAPQVTETSPGYERFPGVGDGRYVLCVLRSRALASQGHAHQLLGLPAPAGPTSAPPAAPGGESSFEALA